MDASLYKRPDKPKRVAVKLYEGAPETALLSEPQVPAFVEVDSATECHVTPADVAERMIDYIGTSSGRWLEPEAGTGNLVAAMIQAGVEPGQITAVERHVGLVNCIDHRFAEYSGLVVENQCFLEYSQEAKGSLLFDYIVMNPPFRKCRQHVGAALDLLAEGGELVALVPITYQNDRANELELLPRDTFANAIVATKLISICNY